MIILPYPSDFHDAVSACNWLHDELYEFLRTYDVPKPVARNISDLTVKSYSRDGLYYHTCKHVFYLIHNADYNGIDLESWEKLAIFFHDVVYHPGKRRNEILSGYFMRSMCEPYLPWEMVNKTEYAIQQTANYLKPDVSMDVYKILDLDLIGFACKKDDFDRANKDIEKEFSCFTKGEYLSGRVEFLKQLIDRAPIYRSEGFACLEEKAIYNIKNELDDCVFDLAVEEKYGKK